jgi:hypothetical protein
VRLSVEEMARLNLDFLERLEASVVDEATAITTVEPEVKVDTVEIHPEAKSKAKPKTFPKVSQ